MNLADGIILAILAIAAGFAVRTMVRRRKSGGCGCGCEGCTGCPRGTKAGRKSGE